MFICIDSIWICFLMKIVLVLNTLQICDYQCCHLGWEGCFGLKFCFECKNWTMTINIIGWNFLAMYLKNFNFLVRKVLRLDKMRTAPSGQEINNIVSMNHPWHFHILFCFSKGQRKLITNYPNGLNCLLLLVKIHASQKTSWNNDEEIGDCA